MQLSEFVTQRNARQASILPPAMRGAVLAETVAQQAIEDAQAAAVAAVLADEKSLRREVLQAEAAVRQAYAERERAGVDFRRLTAVCGQLQLTVLKAENALSARLKTLWPQALPAYKLGAAVELLQSELDRVEGGRPAESVHRAAGRDEWRSASGAAGFHQAAEVLREALFHLHGIERGEREPVADLDRYIERVMEQARGQRAA